MVTTGIDTEGKSPIPEEIKNHIEWLVPASINHGIVIFYETTPEVQTIVTTYTDFMQRLGDSETLVNVELLTKALNSRSNRQIPWEVINGERFRNSGVEVIPTPTDLDSVGCIYPFLDFTASNFLHFIDNQEGYNPKLIGKRMLWFTPEFVNMLGIEIHDKKPNKNISVKFAGFGLKDLVWIRVARALNSQHREDYPLARLSTVIEDMFNDELMKR